MSRPQSAAFTAPRAKIERSKARCVSSMLLALAGEIDGVLADDRPTAQRREADGAALARARLPVAAAHGVVLEADTPALGGGFAQQQRGAGRRVDLVAVVHFQDLDVEVGVERLGGLAHESGEQVDAEAHVAGADDDGMARGGAQALVVGGGQAGGADDMDDARLCGELGEGDGRARRGEIEDAVRLGEERRARRR